jgi:hypothetical protein
MARFKAAPRTNGTARTATTITITTVARAEATVPAVDLDSSRERMKSAR